MMAAEKDTNIYDFVNEGTVFAYDRLAEDVLYHLYSEFAVQKRLIPPYRCSENYYKKEGTVRLVSRQCKLFQIKLRSFMFDAFTRRCDITDLYKYFSVHFETIAYFIAREVKSFSPIDKFYLSFALLAELTLFCILKNKPKVIKKTAKTWVSFFQNNLKKEFEKDGGISEVLRRAQKKWYMDAFIFNFIPAHCVPYKGQKLYDLYVEELKNSSFKQMKVGNSVAWVSINDSLLDMKADEYKKLSEEAGFDPMLSVTPCDRPGAGVEALLRQQLDGKYLHSKVEAASRDTNDVPIKALKEDFYPLLSMPYHEYLGLPLQEEVLKLSCDPKMLAPQAEAASIDSYEVAVKATSELSLKEEDEKSKLRRSIASLLNHKRSVSNVDILSATGVKEPETKSCDRLPASNEPTRNDLVDLLPQVPEPPEPSREYVENLQSVSENTTDNYSILGARPKTGMSFKTRLE